MQRISAEVNGAAYDIHYMARIEPMLLVHLFLHWYPDQPSWCTGEIMLCGSNPSVPDMVATIPANLKLQVGEAIVSVPGLPVNPNLMKEGDWLAHGQVRALSLSLTWMEHASQQDLATVYAWSNSLIQVRGIERLMADGNPFLPADFDALAWTNSMLSQVVSGQHDWITQSPLEPAVDSDATGAQGSQSFIGGPAMADATAISVLYLAALDGSWPMCHFEQDGRTLDWRAHPNLRMYRGQANTRICTDWLGKPRQVTMPEAHGYVGPDDEHWFDFAEFAGARLKGTPATQRMIEAHAINFLFRWVTDEPGNWLSANRAMGWMGMLAAELFRGLANRELAEAVADRYRQVVDRLVIPQMLPGDAWWDWRTNGFGGTPTDPGAAPWQAEVMCVGMYLGGMATGHQPSVDMAYHMAEEIIKLAWFKDANGYWHSHDIIKRSGALFPPQYNDSYAHFGMKACDVLLKRDPAHKEAGEIWRQRKIEATTVERLAWFIPGVKTTV